MSLGTVTHCHRGFPLRFPFEPHDGLVLAPGFDHVVALGVLLDARKLVRRANPPPMPQAADNIHGHAADRVVSEHLDRAQVGAW